MMTQQNAHVYAFWNAPLAERAGWTRIQLSEIERRLSQGGYESADGYYADRELARKFRAGLVGKKSWEFDPMGYHFDMQSN